MRRGLIGTVAESQCPGQLLANEGSHAAHFEDPGDCGLVVTPGPCVCVLEGDKLFKDHVVEEHASHFQVIDGNVATIVNEVIDNVIGPFDTPHNGVEVSLAGQPDTACTIFTSITETNVCWHARNELPAVSRALLDNGEEGFEVLEGLVLERAWMYEDMGGISS